MLSAYSSILQDIIYPLDRIILSGASYFRDSNNIQAAWNYKSLTAKTFDGHVLKMKAVNFCFSIKEQKTMFPVLSWPGLLFGFACSIGHRGTIMHPKNWAW